MINFHFFYRTGETIEENPLSCYGITAIVLYGLLLFIFYWWVEHKKKR